MNMNPSLGNPYKIARKAAHLTQEAAAEYLNISTESLSKYESGKVIPSDSMVLKMVHIYDTPHLAVQHMETNEVARSVLPKVSIKELSPATLNLLKVLNDFERLKDNLIKIASDNRIGEDEYGLWMEVEDVIRKLIEAGYETVYSIKNGD